jgi:hypothetical protein
LPVVEFTTGVQLGHHQFECAASSFCVCIDRNAAPVVANRNHAVRQQFDDDVIGVAGHRFVGRVVENFAHKHEQAGAPVSPIYIPGRWRTASSPSSQVMFSAE